MKIEVDVEQAVELQGTVTVVDVSDPTVSVEFVGWLGLIHALSQLLEPAATGPPGEAVMRTG